MRRGILLLILGFTGVAQPPIRRAIRTRGKPDLDYPVGSVLAD